MKKITVMLFIAVTLNAGWFGNNVENSLENVKKFQCKKLEESIRNDLNLLQTENSKDVYSNALFRVEKNIPIMGMKCDKDYSDLQPLIRDIRDMVSRTTVEQ
jgi:hypothetical protein